MRRAQGVRLRERPQGRRLRRALHMRTSFLNLHSQVLDAALLQLFEQYNLILQYSARAQDGPQEMERN